MANFTHLHVHSHYSLLDGLSKIDELVLRAKELGMESLAITDHGVMYGAVEFYEKAKAAGLKPIIGCEVYIAPRSHLDKQPKIDTFPYHLILLAKNKEGYQNLVQLVTRGHLEGHYYKPRVDKELLRQYSGGLIALSACLQGEIPRTAINKGAKFAKEVTQEYLDIFGQGNFYLELQSHPHLPDQGKANKILTQIAKDLGVGLVATNDCHYLTPQDKESHEILLAINTNKDIDDAKRLSLKDFDISLKSSEDMVQAFKDTPEAIAATQKIVDACHLELDLGTPILPEFPTPKKQEAMKYLRGLAEKGFASRYPSTDQTARGRLEYELSIIEKTNFANYFLIVADFVNWAKNQGIVVGPGRGSAAGSIVSYCLNVTDLDPLKYGLLFERFLNPERIAPPDIDLDFADDRRGEVIQYITQKYGKDHVAQIITFGTMASRGSVRDVGRALGMAYADVDKIAKLIPFGLTLDQSLKAVPDLLELYNQDPPVRKLIDLAGHLEGVARHASVHAAGLVIAKEPLVNYLPLQLAPRGTGEIITQYSMYDIEKIGLLKIDLLGLANLTIIKNALRIIRQLDGKDIDISQIPLSDRATFGLLSRAETTGIFQLESDGIKRYLKELRPTNLADIIAMVALYRPGPMEFIPDYIAGKHGRKAITYLHPKLKPILQDTYGIAVYQEQVLEIAREIAGFTLGEADVLRKAIGKKIQRLLVQQERKFIEGASRLGIDEKISRKIFEFAEPFARYGFNRAHAACYGMIAYQTAYLKTHYPAAFMAAVLTSHQQDIEKIGFFIAEAERMKIKVHAPDINESFAEFGVIRSEDSKDYIRFGLAAIKNVGQGVAEAIVQERQKKGPYESLEDFISRLDSTIINKKVIESLAKAGALDRFAERNQILAGVEEILKFNRGQTASGKNGQIGLFETGTLQAAKLTLPEVEKAPKKQALAWERELLGIYLSEHPLKDVNHIIIKHATPLNELSEDMTGQKVKVGGIISAIQKIITKSGEPMLFVKLEDMTSGTEILVFPKVLQKNNFIWQPDNIVLVEGTINTKDGTPKVIAQSVVELGHQETLELEPASQQPETVTLILAPQATKDTLHKLKELLTKYPGQTSVSLQIPRDGGFESVKAKTKISWSEDLEQKIGLVAGVEKVELD